MRLLSLNVRGLSLLALSAITYYQFFIPLVTCIFLPICGVLCSTPVLQNGEYPLHDRSLYSFSDSPSELVGTATSVEMVTYAVIVII